MALFRRRVRPFRTSPAVAEFWRWWASTREVAAAAIDAGADPAGVPGLVARAAAVGPGLEAELGPGRRARYALSLSGSGRPELRTAAERWRRSGPPDDEVWEYHPARPPAPTRLATPYHLAARDVDLGTTVVDARTDDLRCRLDVGVHHPALADPTLPEEVRSQVALLALTWALGEDDVERWLGEVTVLQAPPLDAVPIQVLSAVTTQLADRWRGDRWALLEGSHGQRRLVAAIRHPLHRVDHALLDEHLGVRLTYTDAGLDGLPGELATGDLSSFQDALVTRLGGAALLAAHETTSGERLLHVYGDSTASARETVKAALASYAGGSATLTVQADPGWRLIDHLRL